MSPFVQLILVLSIILFAAKLAGYLSTLLGQPSVLGELLVGVLLGPSLLDITHSVFITDTHLTEVVIELGELGVLFLMFLAGLELHIKDLARNTKVSALAGTLGVIFPVGLGLLVGLIMNLPFDQAFFLGLTLGATSVSISAQTLMELKVLRSRVGLGLLGAAVFDDVLVILFLSTFLALYSGASGIIEILWVLVRMVIFLLLSIGVGLTVLPFLTRIINRLPISQGTLTLAVFFTLVYGFAAEVIGGMASITGAFIAGLMFARTPEKQAMDSGLRSLAYGFFVPIFFITVGLNVDLHLLGWDALWIMLFIAAVAVVGKILGAGLGAKLAHYSWLESLQLGIGMVSRGEVGLIIAAVGVTEGLINNEFFSAIIGMVLVTTLVTPPLLRATFRKPKSAGKSDHPQVQEVA